MIVIVFQRLCFAATWLTHPHSCHYYVYCQCVYVYNTAFIYNMMSYDVILPPLQSDNDELNKTLPHNFKFGQHLTAPPTMQSSSLRSSPIRSMASSSRSPRTTSIQRRQPVAANSRPSPSRFKNKERCHHLNKSDPAIARNVSVWACVCVL